MGKNILSSLQEDLKNCGDKLANAILELDKLADIDEQKITNDVLLNIEVSCSNYINILQDLNEALEIILVNNLDR